MHYGRTQQYGTDDHAERDPVTGAVHVFDELFQPDMGHLDANVVFEHLLDYLPHLFWEKEGKIAYLKDVFLAFSYSRPGFSFSFISLKHRVLPLI